VNANIILTHLMEMANIHEFATFLAPVISEAICGALAVISPLD
jgi:hypothetical protein